MPICRRSSSARVRPPGSSRSRSPPSARAGPRLGRCRRRGRAEGRRAGAAGDSSLPGLSPYSSGAGIGLHNYAFGDLSWLQGGDTASSAYWSPLLPRSGVTLDRVVDDLPRDLVPRLDAYLQGRAPGDPLSWMSANNFPIELSPDPSSAATRPFTGDELLSIESLVRRYNVDPSSLSSSELQLLREAARVHIGGSTPAAPFASYSRPGELVPWTGQRTYVVRVNVDRSAALDVSSPNAFNQGAQAITNVEEAEFLVVGDQSGRIVSVQRIADPWERGRGQLGKWNRVQDRCGGPS